MVISRNAAQSALVIRAEIEIENLVNTHLARIDKLVIPDGYGVDVAATQDVQTKKEYYTDNMRGALVVRARREFLRLRHCVSSDAIALELTLRAEVAEEWQSGAPFSGLTRVKAEVCLMNINPRNLFLPRMSVDIDGLQTAIIAFAFDTDQARDEKK